MAGLDAGEERIWFRPSRRPSFGKVVHLVLLKFKGDDCSVFVWWAGAVYTGRRGHTLLAASQNKIGH